MNKEVFIKRINEVGKNTVDFSKEYVFNKLSENIEFTIKPNSLKVSNHLNEFEKKNLIDRIKEINRTFRPDEIADRLLINGKIPIWINSSVIKTSKNETIVELLTSRRFGTDDELYHQNDRFPPFHINITRPPYQAFDGNKKFDVNWRFNKIKTAYKLWKSKAKLKKLISNRNKFDKTEYWNKFDKVCHNYPKVMIL